MCEALNSNPSATKKKKEEEEEEKKITAQHQIFKDVSSVS
jgi:hypothetical protein